MTITNFEKGIDSENRVARVLKKEIPNECEIEQNHSWGVDIVVRNKDYPPFAFVKEIKVEVKSANEKVKNGNKGLRSGKFSFYPNNLNKPDYFAFEVCKLDNKITTYWVKGEVIQNHFKDHKRKTKLTLGVPTLLQRISKVDFSEVIKL